MKYSIFSHALHYVFSFYEYPYSKDWDETLNKLMTKGEITELTERTITFFVGCDSYKVWISNRHYSFGHIWAINDINVRSELYRRPSFKNIRALSALVVNQKRLRESSCEAEIRSTRDKVNNAFN